MIVKTAALLRERLPDVGITALTGYAQQAKKIRGLAYAENIALQSKTAEAFQGREDDVILLSITRSRKTAAIAVDQKCSIGFLKQPKRQNVVTSRAKNLMVIFGNAELLLMDEHWRQVLVYCHGIGCLYNVPPRILQTVLSGVSATDSPMPPSVPPCAADTDDCVDRPWEREE